MQMLEISTGSTPSLDARAQCIYAEVMNREVQPGEALSLLSPEAHYVLALARDPESRKQFEHRKAVLFLEVLLRKTPQMIIEIDRPYSSNKSLGLTLPKIVESMLSRREMAQKFGEHVSEVGSQCRVMGTEILLQNEKNSGSIDETLTAFFPNDPETAASYKYVVLSNLLLARKLHELATS